VKTPRLVLTSLVVAALVVLAAFVGDGPIKPF
jgi:hypothetical protein